MFMEILFKMLLFKGVYSFTLSTVLQLELFLTGKYSIIVSFNLFSVKYTLKYKSCDWGGTLSKVILFKSG